MGLRFDRPEQPTNQPGCQADRNATVETASPDGVVSEGDDPVGECGRDLRNTNRVAVSAWSAGRFVTRAEPCGRTCQLPHAGKADGQHANGKDGAQEPGCAQERRPEDRQQPERRRSWRSQTDADIAPAAQRKLPQRVHRRKRSELPDRGQASEHDAAGTDEKHERAEERGDGDDTGREAVVGHRPLGHVPDAGPVGGDVRPQRGTSA